MPVNRFRSYERYSPVYNAWAIETENVTADAGSGLCPFVGHAHTSVGADTLIPLTYSRGTMEDSVVQLRGKSTRRRFRNYLIPRAPKPCYHLYGKLLPAKDTTTFVHHVQTTSSLCNFDSTITQTCNPFAFLCRRYGVDYIKDHILDNLPRTHFGITFSSPDWVALTSDFDQACKSLVPDNFFAGEAFAEGSIFLDAIKLVLNPKKAIVHFIKDVRNRGLHRLNLGEISAEYKKIAHSGNLLVSHEEKALARGFATARFSTKEIVSQHLGYQFGVVPAIQEIRGTLLAHSAVDRRLDYLNRHRGQYVPVRVKRGYPAAFTSIPFTSPFLDFGLVLQKCYAVGSIFGMGRIRADINESSRWRAYMEYFGINKAVGTAWELIPFSFVVDWFTNAQERINQLTRLPLGESPFMNLTAIGCSTKNIALYDYVCNPGYDQTNGYNLQQPDSQFPVFSYAVTEYTRLPYIPDTSTVVDLSTLGSFQGWAAGELLIQKFL